MWVAIAAVVLGHEIASLLWQRQRVRPEPFQMALSAALLGSVAWLGSTWLLALLHVMTAPALWARTVLFAVCAAALWYRRTRGQIADTRRTISTADALVMIAVLMPVIVWLVFVLWRGVIIPPLAHDALAYHLPKAVLYSRAHGFSTLDELNFNIRTLPANYEMLLADVMTVDGSDRYTEWVGTLFFVFFLVAALALLERWWRGGMLAALGALVFLATSPALLLHSGAHKNDLMTAFFMVAMLTWAGRWFASRELVPLVLLGLSTAAAIGTKPQTAGLALTLFVITAARVVQERLRPRVVLGLVALLLAALALLGGAVYAANALHEGAAFKVSAGGGGNTMVQYGDWANFWRGPYVLFAEPFSSSRVTLRVPWTDEEWFLPRYEIYFSHHGVIFAICALLVPVGMVLFRRDFTEARRERLLITAAAVATFAMMLPARWTPTGLFPASLPRFTFFLLPVVFGWTLVPLVRRCAAKRLVVARTIVLAGAGSVLWTGVDVAVNDAFAPLDFVQWAAQRPGTRTVPFSPYRPASVVDRMAGPQDHIAFDAGFGAWIQPAFGAGLTRPITFLDHSTTPVRIPEDAGWVIIDRSWNSIWGDPRFTHLKQWRSFLAKSRVPEEELKTIRQLLADPCFRPVRLNLRAGTGVFRRVGVAGSSPRAGGEPSPGRC